MDTRRIADLLAPFAGDELLLPAQVEAFSAYLDLLLRWNQRVNLTAVRSPEQMVTRHFGESLFAARHLLSPGETAEVADLGSGAGFPGLPLRIMRPAARVTLIESQNKKATFLKEVIRALGLCSVEVVTQRAEDLDRKFDLVAMRAVERFDRTLPVAVSLVKNGGRLGLLIGADQVARTQALLPAFAWAQPVSIPQSTSRVLLAGRKPEC